MHLHYTQVQRVLIYFILIKLTGKWLDVVVLKNGISVMKQMVKLGYDDQVQ